MPALISRWTLDVRVVAPHAPDNEAVAREGAGLLARWNEPSRRYHTTTHLVEMFGALEELDNAREIDDRQCSVARLAAWFHDAVYDPAAASGSNEADSALLARDTLQRLSFGDEDMDAIDRLIRLTARHEAHGSERLDAAFHDADLWILSAPQARFDGYCDQVRDEYAFVPDALYRNARASVLGPLLHRDRTFHTPHALHNWEAPARINLSRELARLHPQT
ncbi:MAG: metal-dependent phosphohydrolase [Dermatophilaceae bacterium]|nr:metal-dependent phosphohydrolase [Dermatophilaceae bacterium]